MSHEVKIHDAQTSILRELLFHPEAGFAELQKPTGLDSDYFKFHIGRLLELGYVSKTAEGKYRLTQKGKEHANKLDTDTNTIERQPKISVLIVGWRKREGSDDMEYLVQQRLKNPYYGFWGRIGGKVRWGETVEEAALRELKEETGLGAKVEYVCLYHKMDYRKDNDEMLEDKFFITVKASEFTGKFMENFEGGRNAWLTQEEIALEKKSFGGLGNSDQYVKGMRKDLIEEKHIYEEDEY